MQSLVLYSYFKSSVSHRVRIALELKQLKYEYKAVDLLKDGGEQNLDSFRKLNPSGEVPCLLYGSDVIAQSMAIMEFLDTLIPEPRLFPDAPLRRAHVVRLCEIVNSGAAPLHNLKVLNELARRFGASDESQHDWARFWIRQSFESIESVLGTTVGKYSFGDQITAADVFLIPEVLRAERFGLVLSTFPRIAAIFNSCQLHDAFALALPQRQPDFLGV